MAIAHGGINGPFSGKVGTVVGYTLNGQQVMRMVGRRKRPFTALELLNQAKMRAVSKFLAPIKPFVKFGYQREAPPGSRVGAFQLAQSYVWKNAIVVNDGGEVFVDPAKVLISRGTLAPPLNATVELEDTRFTIRWEQSDGARGDDRLMFLLYDGGTFRHFQEIGAERKAGMESKEISWLRFAENPIHVYAAFRDTFFDRISDSVHCGVLTPA
ncbi:DUF6266 family protein [Parapedobacter soli]|uniref:DUF6266 family protein n=1 Tax=Parapedobacter soli TaxID=416955 RepID=UPI0021C92D3F|nr:DUF6266 family protein [Parapedobacter soli]